MGIALHRAIDLFTDSHMATREAKEVFRPHYRLYAGALVDVVYDHFLANDDNEFTASSLLSFSEATYTILDNYSQWLPERFAGMFHYMKMQNWLYHYRYIEGIRKSFGGLVRRAAYLSESKTAELLLEKHYQLLQECYRHFWVEIKPYAKNFLDQLMNDNHT